MIANSSSGSAATWPVAATQPISGGKAPAAPPMTIFCARARLQPDGVDQHVEQDRHGEQRGREPVGRKAHQQHREERQARRRNAAPTARSIRPAGSGRLAVRRIFASRSASYHWLSAPHAPAPSAMHRIAVKPSTSGGIDRRDEQAAQAGEDDEAHHARLGQREEIAPVGRQRGWIAHLQGGHGGGL